MWRRSSKRGYLKENDEEEEEEEADSKTRLPRVKTVALCLALALLGFVVGLVVGYFKFYRAAEDAEGGAGGSGWCPPPVRAMPSDNGRDADGREGAVLEGVLSRVGIGRPVDSLPDFLIKPHLLNDQSQEEIRGKLDLPREAEGRIFVHRCRLSAPRHKKHLRSSVRFLSEDDELLTREPLRGVSFGDSFRGAVKARVILIERWARLEDLNISTVKGAMVLTPLDPYSFDKAQFFEAVGVKAVLLYRERSLADCDGPRADEKPHWWFSEQDTARFESSGGAYRIPLSRPSHLKIPVAILSCQTVLDVLPHLASKRVVVGDLEVTPTQANVTVTNLFVTFHGRREPGTSLMIGASRNNEAGTRRWLRLLRSFSASAAEEAWYGLGRRPARMTTSFVSWDSLGFGMSEFVKTYRTLWTDRPYAYVDLDRHELDEYDHVTASSSLEDFARRVTEQISDGIGLEAAAASPPSRFLEDFSGSILERELGIPYVKAWSSAQGGGRGGEEEEGKGDPDEEQILRTLGAVIASASEASPLPTSPARTAHEVARAVRQLAHLYPAARERLPGLQSLLQKTLASIERYENASASSSMSSSSSLPASARARDSGGAGGDGRLRAGTESGLRVALRRLTRLANSPLPRFLRATDSHVGDRVRARVSRSFFDDGIVARPCPIDDSFDLCMVGELSSVLSGLQDVATVLRSVVE